VCDVFSAPSIYQASDVTEVRCLVLRGLPVLLGDDPSTFFKACFVSNSDFSLPPLLSPYHTYYFKVLLLLLLFERKKNLWWRHTPKL